MTPPSIRKVVLAPNLIGAALIDPGTRRVIEAWRDGKFVAVFSRDLIAQHLRVLNRIGLSQELVKRWAFWLTSPEKTLFVDLQIAPPSPFSLCEELAQAIKTDAILCWRLPSAARLPLWMLASDYGR